MSTIRFTIDGHLPSRANLRVHWAQRARMARTQRMDAKVAALNAIRGRRLNGPVAAVLVRVSPRPLDDDNLQAAFKSIRDGIADALGIDDRDPRVSWNYAQEKGKPPHMRVEIQRQEKP